MIANLSQAVILSIASYFFLKYYELMFLLLAFFERKWRLFVKSQFVLNRFSSTTKLLLDQQPEIPFVIEPLIAKCGGSYAVPCKFQKSHLLLQNVVAFSMQICLLPVNLVW